LTKKRGNYPDQALIVARKQQILRNRAAGFYAAKQQDYSRQLNCYFRPSEMLKSEVFNKIIGKIFASMKKML